MLSVFTLVVFSSCSTATRHRGEEPVAPSVPEVSGPPPEAQGPPAPFGPPVPVASPTETYGPKKIEIRPIVLVLGPGAAKGFAHAGVIRALYEAKVPIGAILGTEMGALVGSLYGLTDSINRFDWAMAQLREESLYRPTGLLSKLGRRESDGAALLDKLEHIVGAKDLRASKVPLRIVISSLKRASPQLIATGPAARAMRAAVGVTGWISPSDWEGERTVSSLIQRPYPVSEGKFLGLGPVVVVDLLSSRSSIHAADPQFQKLYSGVARGRSKELGDADLVLEPELKDVGLSDFNRSADAIFQGKKAVQASLPMLRKLAGLPDESPVEEQP